MAYVRTRRIIDDAGADAVIAAAERRRREQGSRVVIAVVDPYGELVAAAAHARARRSRAPAWRVDKARTAAIFVRPSREMEEQVTDGRLGALALHGASCLTGGIPLEGRRRGRRRDRHERRDARRGRGDLDRRRRGASSRRARSRRSPTRARGTWPRPSAPRRPQRGVAPVVSAVDAGGALIYLRRPDAAQVASVEVTTDKARTAAIYRRPSPRTSRSRPRAAARRRCTSRARCRSRAAMPIEDDGEVVGAIGVSGASSADEDQELALIGAAALLEAGERRATAPRSSPATTLGAKFADGRPAARRRSATRSTPAAARRRARSSTTSASSTSCTSSRARATVVTGGEMRRAARGRAGRAARERRRGRHARTSCSEGDVLAIPNGVPHQFTDVSDPFLYFVVKVEA